MVKRAPAPKKPRRKTSSPVLFAMLIGQVALALRSDGMIFANFGDFSIELGKFSLAAGQRTRTLLTGVPLDSLSSARDATGKEFNVLIQRLAERGLLEYRLGLAKPSADQVVIEPQMPDYVPRTPKLAASDRIVLSRFCYMRRRGHEMILESPRAGALFRIRDPKVAAALAAMVVPNTISKLRREDGYPGDQLVALLLDCQMLFKVEPSSQGLRDSEGDDRLVLWDFHDLLFHTHSTEGRQANPLGGLYPYAGVMPPPPAIRARWPGKAIILAKAAPAPSDSPSTFVTLAQARHSVRGFDEQRPITLAELSQLLDRAARIQSKWSQPLEGGGPVIDYTTRPYPAAGSSYELELYLTVNNCEGLERGFYHYDADRHALVPIKAGAHDIDTQLGSAEFAMDAPDLPQVLITMAARFERISWKYSSIAYSLMLKDVGVLIQTLYLAATDLGLGGCAIGSNNIDLFALMTGIEFHVEGPVGQFALGRGLQDENG
jgi:SagB-type dehydrogenase family enzyme